MKTARQLRITAKEYEALLKVRDLLSKREVLFDMGTILNEKRYRRGFGKDVHNCGTVGCIGGWMAVIMHGGLDDFNFDRMSDDVISYVERGRSSALDKLFYPGGVHVDLWSEITPGHAIRAMDNFMNTGDPDWLSIMQENI